MVECSSSAEKQGVDTSLRETLLADEGDGLTGTERGARSAGDPLRMTRRSMLAALGLSAVAACSGNGTSASPSPTSSSPTSATTTTPRSTASTSPTPSIPPAGTLYYGAFTPPYKLAEFEAQIGTEVSCYRSFFKAEQTPELIERANLDVAQGRVPLLSIKPPKPWAALARDNAFLDGLVEPLSELDGPVYLTINHEPENDAHHFGTSSDYVDLQNAAIARAALAGGKVTIVPILSSWSFDERAQRTPSDWNVEAAEVYGLDLYNFWSVDNGVPWVSFADKLLLAEKDAGERPMIVGEYGCRSDPARPGRAAKWMRDAFDTAMAEGVIAMAYFDSAQGAVHGTWELDAETLPVFAEISKSDDVARI